MNSVQYSTTNRWLTIGLVLLALILGTLVLMSWMYFAMIQMPGESFRGQLPPLTSSEVALRNTRQRDVEKLASEIGQRNYLHYERLLAAAQFLETSLTAARYQVQQQEYEIGERTYYNILLGAGYG